MGTSKVSFADARGFFLGNKICRQLRVKNPPMVKEWGVLIIMIF